MRHDGGRDTLLSRCIAQAACLLHGQGLAGCLVALQRNAVDGILVSVLAGLLIGGKVNAILVALALQLQRAARCLPRGRVVAAHNGAHGRALFRVEGVGALGHWVCIQQLLQLIGPKTLNPSRHTLVSDLTQQLVGLGAGLLWQCRQALFHGGGLGLRLLFGGQAQAILGLRGLLRLHRCSGPPFVHSSSGHLGDRATVRVQAQILAGLACRLVLPGQQ